jgi:hypothetical protein
MTQTETATGNFGKLNTPVSEKTELNGMKPY